MLAVDQLGRLTLGTSTSANIFLNGGASTTRVADSNSIAIGNEALFYTSTTSTSLKNIAFGYRALMGSSTALMTGINNFAAGYNSLVSNTTGGGNIAIGNTTLNKNTTGSDNFAAGNSALFTNTTGYGNFAVGNGSLFANTTGSNNFAVGVSSLFNNTTGSDNTALGAGSLLANTTGYGNIALGTTSLRYNTTGTSNIALGMFALRGSSTVAMTGSNNIALGYYAGYSNTIGSNNFFSGFDAGFSNTSGGDNIFIGQQAGESNTTGSNNTFFGYSAGISNTTGRDNTFFGSQSGNNNTTGFQNIFSGNHTGYNNTTGSNNIFSGEWSGASNNLGSNNIFSGYYSGYDNTTGQGNIAIGYQSGAFNETGDYNLALGYDVAFSSTTASNQLNIGNLIYGQGISATSSALINTSNISIGTSSPINNSKFSIQGSGSLNPFSVASSSGSTFFTVLSNGKVGIGTSTPLSMFTVQAASAVNPFDIASSTGASMFKILSTGNVLVGTSTIPSLASLYIAGSMSSSTAGSTGAIAGIHGEYTFNPSAGGVQVGNRFVINNTPTSTANTAIGQILRMVDNSALANTVRGLEIVASVGTNTNGVNTGIRSTGGTFGIQAITTGLAGGSLTPAAIYGENTGTTQGDVLRLYSSTVTTAPSMATIFQETSAYSGTGLLMNLGATGGSFSGNFIDLQKNGISQFSVSNNGSLITGGNIFASGTLSILGGSIFSNATATTLTASSTFYVGTSSLIINSSGVSIGTSTVGSSLDVYKSTGASDVDIFRILSDVGSGGNVKFRIDSDGDIFTDGGTTIGTPADLAENYPTEESVLPGMIVAFSTSTTQDWSYDNGETSSSTFAMATVRSARAGDEALGVISTRPGIILGGNTHNGKSVAFSGRVPVLVTNENGVVKSGDLLTISTGTPGYAMKQTESGYSIGRAISSAEDIPQASVLMLVDNKHRTVTIASLSGLEVLTEEARVSSSVPSTSIYSLIAEKISHGNTVVTEYLALSVKGVSGYFDKLFAKEIYTEKMCVKKSNGTNVCLTGDQVESMLNTTQMQLLTPGTTGSSTGGTTGGSTPSAGGSMTGDTGTGSGSGTGSSTDSGTTNTGSGAGTGSSTESGSGSSTSVFIPDTGAGTE
jgi:hypothetical protein